MVFSLSGYRRQLNGAIGFVVVCGGLLDPGLAAAEDARHGQSVFNGNCAICHSVSAGKNIVGPSLFNVVGRKAGAAAGFGYSRALKASGLIWTSDNLDKWLTSPRAFVPMNQMSFSGLHNPSDRQDVIAFLAKQK